MKLRGGLILVLLLMTVGGIKASENLASLEAMFIYNFTRLIQWPDGSTGNVFVIGVYSNDEVFDALVGYTQNRKVGSRAIEVKRINSVEEAKTCQLLFVPNEQMAKIKEIKSSLGNHPCMVVGEKEGSNGLGATIEFVVKDNKLSFRINEGTAKSQNLLVSGALLDMGV